MRVVWCGPVDTQIRDDRGQLAPGGMISCAITTLASCRRSARPRLGDRPDQQVEEARRQRLEEEPAPGMLRKFTAFVPRYRKFESISLQQTDRLSPAATFERQEPGHSPQVCEARLTTGSAETQKAFHCAPTGGNVSAGPYSSTAVRLMRSAAMPRRSERNQEFPGFSVGSL